jgi:hypothetical protein
MSDKKTQRRSFNPINLSFLDVMSCGLGAVILVFLILKHGESISPQEEVRVENDITTIKLQIEDIKKEILNVTNNIDNRNNEVKKLKTQNEIISVVIQEELNNQRLSQEELQNIELDLKQLERQNIDIIQVDNGGERQYLTGLKVEGKRIAILLDSSASMLDETIINIIRRDLFDAESRQKSLKWIRAKKSAKWLVNRLPADSHYTFITFSESVVSLTNSQWLNSTDDDSMKILLGELDLLVPSGGTNLEKALIFIKSLEPMPDSLYLITDGLPTIGEEVEKLSSDFLEKCFRNRQRQKKSISSECRHQLFQKAKKGFLNGRKIKTSTILLPLEGDPRAASDYWNLSIQSGGLLISPSMDWP